MTGKGHEGTFWVVEMFHVLTGVEVPQEYAFVKFTKGYT